MYVQLEASRLALTNPPERTGERRPVEDAGDMEHLHGNVYICRACRARVTSPAARIQVAGSHRHTFVNPQGEGFEIGCFSEARGVVGVGGATEHFTWFPGAPWRAAICGGCATQLGWAFGEPIGFYGLVLTRIALVSQD